MTYRKKLIEVSLPLEAINREAARENYIYRGNPSAIHKWWAQRPLATCRAVLFSSLVDDPSEYMPDEETSQLERERLFEIIKELVVWENSNNEEVLDKARLEIARSVARTLDQPVPVGKEAIREFLATKAPPVLDPFAGGGSIPLEAQRLGLRTYASDLNPVAVLINKALIEIPPKFANLPPVHPPEETPAPNKKGKKVAGTMPLFAQEWKGAQGLAEDVRYYGNWMHTEAFKRVGHLYPPVTITKELLAERPDLKEQGLTAGDQLTVIAWLWARTVKCPNPACGAQMPLVKSFVVSTKKGRRVWVEPRINQSSLSPQITFHVHQNDGIAHEGTINRHGAHCCVCNTPVSFEYIRLEGQEHRLESVLMAVVVETKKGRRYLDPGSSEDYLRPENEESILATTLPEQALGLRVQKYGMTKHRDLFSDRQLYVLNQLNLLLDEVRDLILRDYINLGKSLGEAEDYAKALLTYLAFALDKLAMYNCALIPWYTKEDRPSMLFSRQAISMVWDFAEINPFADIGGGLSKSMNIVTDSLASLPIGLGGTATNQDVTSAEFHNDVLVSTDPPYYDNVPYADLSDFFYVWLRKGLSRFYQDLFLTMLVPKSEELVADPYRYGSKDKAEDHFLSGMGKAFTKLKHATSPNCPTTIYYAFKQSESEDDSENTENTSLQSSTGWETMLLGLIESGFSIIGTWPMRTERTGRMREASSNALASSIVLVCRARLSEVDNATRREFLAALKKEIGPALRKLQQGSIAPVDLAQAAIGPGMAVFSRYSAVLEADGKPMSVRTALTLINQALDEYLTEQEGEYDADTRWALAWFEQFGHNEGQFGVAETLSKAKNTSVSGLDEAGILEARAGKVRLYRRDELDTNWDPTQDKRLTAWEACQHLIYALENGGEEPAARLLARLSSTAEPARDLAYRLYTVCERKGWAQDALGYNSLVVAWPRLKELAVRKEEAGQPDLL